MYININLPFTDENTNPLPGGFYYLVQKRDTIQTSFACGSRTANLSELIDNHTNFRLASISKQYTAIAILHCTVRKMLKLSDRISPYLTSLPKSLGDITIYQLLNHTSGITDYETLIPSDQKKPITDKDVLSLIEKNGKLYFLPGSQFRYSNTGYCLLTQIVEKVSKMSFARFMNEYVFQPNGLHSSFVYENEKDIPSRAFGFKIIDNKAHSADQNLTSATQGDGGIYTSPVEYVKWIHALFSEKIIKGYNLKLFGNKKVPVEDEVFYNLGWFMREEKNGTRCVFHSGESTGFRNIVYYNLDKNVLLLLFSNIEGKEEELSELFESLLNSLKLKLDLPKPLMEWMSKIYN